MEEKIKYKHIPSGEIFIKGGDGYVLSKRDSLQIVPAYIVEQGKDWQRVEGEPIKFIKTNRGIHDLYTLSKGNQAYFLNEEQIKAIESLLNKEDELYTMDQLVEFADYYRGDNNNNTKLIYKNWAEWKEKRNLNKCNNEDKEELKEVWSSEEIEIFKGLMNQYNDPRNKIIDIFNFLDSKKGEIKQ